MLTRIFDLESKIRSSAVGRRLYPILPYAVFLLLILWSFRKILVSPGIVGHTWDWSIPNFTQQFLDKTWSNFFTWDEALTAGRYFPIRAEWAYWIIILPFSILSGAAVSKLLPMLFLFIAGSSMYKLGRSMLDLSPFWSTIGGIFYMFSPVAYSRIIGGHLPILLGYALLPLVVLYFWRVFFANQDRPKNIIIGGLLFAAEGLHPSTALLSFIILGVIFLFNLLKRGAKRTIIVYSLMLVLIFVLVNSFWIFPSVISYISTGAILHGGGLSVSPKSQVTVSSEMKPRVEYLKNTSQPLTETFRLHARMGMDTEYVYPVADWFELLWAILAFLFPLLSFGVLLTSSWKEERVLFLAVLSLIGVILSAGMSTLFGSIIYLKFLQRFLPIVFFEFSHPSRVMPLVIVSYAALAPYFLQIWVRRIRDDLRIYLALIALIIVLLFSFPFVFGDITKPLIKGTQPLALKVTRVNSEDEKVYDYIRKLPGDFRIVYLPPVGLSWPGDTDLSYEWTSAYAPKPELLGWPYHPLNEEIIASLYSWAPSTNLGKLLGLASVKYLIYPNYELFISYRDFLQDLRSPILIDNFKNYKPLIDRNLGVQTDLISEVMRFRTVTILNNKHFLPQIYASNTSMAVIGGTSILPYLADIGYIDASPAIFFSEQQSAKGLSALLDNSNRLSIAKEDEKLLKSTLGKIGSKDVAYLFSLSADNSSLAKEFYINRDEDYFVEVVAEIRDHYSTEKPKNVSSVAIDGFGIKTSLTREPIEGVFWYRTEKIFLQKGKHEIKVLPPDDAIKLNFVRIMPVKSSELKISPRPVITFRKISPVRYEVEVIGAKNPYFLVFNESFHQGWKAFSGDIGWVRMLLAKPIPEENHFIVNAYANSWYIDRSGSYKLTLFFWPQVFFIFGLLVSGVTLSISLGYLFYRWRFKKV